MKKLILALCAISLLAISTFQPVYADLIAYYNFEGNANDVSGSAIAYNGIFDGNPFFHPTLTSNGYTGQAYSFGGNDYIRADLNINPSVLPAMTMGAWVKSTQGIPIQQVISHDNAEYDRSLGIDFRGGGTGWSAFSGSGEVLGSYPVAIDTWTFIAVVYDQSAGNVTLFVDGNHKSETGTLGIGNDFINIGRNPLAGGIEGFVGVIDDVFFYNEALNIDQLNYIMANGVMPVPVPTTMLLLGSGLIGLAGFRKRFRKR